MRTCESGSQLWPTLPDSVMYTGLLPLKAPSIVAHASASSLSVSLDQYQWTLVTSMAARSGRCQLTETGCLYGSILWRYSEVTFIQLSRSRCSLVKDQTSTSAPQRATT